MIEPTWKAGDMELYLGDCAKVMSEIPADSIDLTVTSPPYDNIRKYNGYVFNFEAIARQLYRVTKPGGVVVWVVCDETINGSETGTSFRQALYFMELGFNLHDTMIYKKNGPSHPDRTRYHQVFEYMFVFSNGRPNHINLLVDRKNRWAGSENFGTRTNRNKDGKLDSSTLAGRTVKFLGTRWNIWEIAGGYGYSSSDEIAYQHPAIFPEALARDHILSWSNPGDMVFDPMCGSGTTGKMAVKYQRRFIGIDISAEYVDIAVKRIKEAQLQMRMPI